jgi:DNA-binding Lrp family transcriptional regulator
MNGEAREKTITIDRLDRQVLHALRCAPRAPFRRIGEVLGASEQTVARRYRKLHEAGVVRVFALPAPVGPGLDWFVRIGVRPGVAAQLADAIAKRPDVSWVSITAGGAEVVCISRPSSPAQRDALLLEHLPRTTYVTTLVSHAILRSFEGERWSGFGDPLEPAERAALLSDPSNPPEEAGGAAGIDPGDRALLDTLRLDGRAGYQQLAAATGWTAARAARRLDALLASRAVYLDVDLAVELLGFPAQAGLWMSVAPSDLDAVGRRVAKLEQTAYAAAVSGPANLFASVVCRDTAGLYAYLSEEIGAIDAVRSAELSPVLRRVKQGSTIVQGSRLPEPTRTRPRA